MNAFELISFPDNAALAQAAASAWRDELAMATQVGKAHCVALSGGRITRDFFSAVVEQNRARNISLNTVDFFWADERCVPPDDSESNFAGAKILLFGPLNIPEKQIHRIYGEDTPAIAAEKATSEICQIAPSNVAGQPVLDLILLGMGEDGHVASLFPGAAEVSTSNWAVYRAVTNSPKPPPNRITLSYAAIAAARQVWVLASGAGKEAALRESLKPGGNTPLANVLRSREGTRVFTDIRV